VRAAVAALALLLLAGTAVAEEWGAIVPGTTTAAAVRAEIEKERGLSQVRSGLRREKAIDFILSRATIVTA